MLDSIGERVGPTLLQRMLRGIWTIDAWLRRRISVFEFTDEPRCIFRIALSCVPQEIVLRDGTVLPRGARMIDLHFWNEQLPPMPKKGLSLEWALQMSGCVELSLRELARYVQARSELDDVLVVRAKMWFDDQERQGQLDRICWHFGFEECPERPPDGFWGRLHLVGENVLISLMTSALGVKTSWRSTLSRGRRQFFMTRKMLMQRYGAASASLAPQIREADRAN